jgi:alkylation response protein AidB-like acyl-CoA dehydrogenase
MNLTSEQKMLQETVRKFVTNELDPQSTELEEAGAFPAEIVRKLAELGLLALQVPEEYGGVAFDTLCLALTLSELSRSSASTAIVILSHNAKVVLPLVRHGTEDQKTDILPALTEGTRLGAMALLEPASGSDYGTLGTTARKDGNGYVLDGEKFLVTGGSNADLFLVFATTDPESGKDGLSVFLVDRNTDGLSVVESGALIGLNSAGITGLRLENCKVPESSRIGEENQGLRILDDVFELSNIGIGAMALGLCESCLDSGVKYAKERVQFGRTICEFGMIQEMIADMAARTEATRSLVHSVARDRDERGDVRTEASLAKLFATDAAMCVTTRTVQIYGGYGYTKDYPVERFMRDAKALQVLDVPNEHLPAIVTNALLR